MRVCIELFILREIRLDDLLDFGRHSRHQASRRDIFDYHRACGNVGTGADFDPFDDSTGDAEDAAFAQPDP